MIIFLPPTNFVWRLMKNIPMYRIVNSKIAEPFDPESSKPDTLLNFDPLTNLL